MMLLLGCVVMCEGKGPLIEKMKGMELTQQHALVAHIQQVSAMYVCVCMYFLNFWWDFVYVVGVLFLVNVCLFVAFKCLIPRSLIPPNMFVQWIGQS